MNVYRKSMGTRFAGRMMHFCRAAKRPKVIKVTLKLATLLGIAAVGKGCAVGLATGIATGVAKEGALLPVTIIKEGVNRATAPNPYKKGNEEKKPEDRNQ